MWEITRQRTFSYPKRRIITRQCTQKYRLFHLYLSAGQPACMCSARQHTYPRVDNACPAPASTHNYFSRRHSHPPAHTFVRSEPGSTHLAYDYFLYSPSAHILSGSHSLNLQSLNVAERAELTRQHTYPGVGLRNRKTGQRFDVRGCRCAR